MAWHLFGVTVAGVTRQRRGDAQAAITRTPGGGLREWLVDQFRFPCPTSSATWAQVWLDLKSNGLPVLTIGVALAIVILLLSAVGDPIDAAFADELRRVVLPERGLLLRPSMAPALYAALTVIVLVLDGNAFGIRRRQGRAYIERVRGDPARTAPRSWPLLKVLVRSVCVLAALIAIGVSAWISVPLLGDRGLHPDMGRASEQSAACNQGAVAALTGYEQLALVVVVAVGVVIWVAAFAVLGALRTRYSRRASIAASLLLLYGLVLALLALGGTRRDRVAVRDLDASSRRHAGSSRPRWCSRPSTSSGAASRSAC